MALAPREYVAPYDRRGEKCQESFTCQKAFASCNPVEFYKNGKDVNKAARLGRAPTGHDERHACARDVDEAEGEPKGNDPSLFFGFRCLARVGPAASFLISFPSFSMCLCDVGERVYRSTWRVGGGQRGRASALDSEEGGDEPHA